MSYIRSGASSLIRIVCRNSLSQMVSSSRVGQQVISDIVINLEYLQGIGIGGGMEGTGQRVLADLLREPPGESVVFDVGANVGAFSQIVRGQVADSVIHQFEPQSACVEKLRNRFDSDAKIVLNEMALSNSETEKTLYYNKEGSGLASLTRRELEHFDVSFDKSEQVSTTTLDSYCAERDISEIDLLKLDVEGHELAVLHGGEDMFNEWAVRYCSFEFGGANIDTKTYFRDFYRFFTERGYKLFRILPNASLYHIKSYQEIDEKFRTTNYLAARADQSVNY